MSLNKCIRSNFMILLNTELPSLCLNYITVNCLHCYNPDLSEARIFTTLVAGTHSSRTNLKAMCISFFGCEVMECIASIISMRLEVCTHLKLKPNDTYYLTTMSKIINKSCDYVV